MNDDLIVSHLKVPCFKGNVLSTKAKLGFGKPLFLLSFFVSDHNSWALVETTV